MRIIFMGTPDFARDSLKAIYEAGHEIVAVITNPDRPKGRGMKMIPTPVKEYAESKNLQIYQPEKVKNNEEIINKIKELKPEVICVVAYGKILPKEILEIPSKGSINVHGSLLPKYRGAAPIQWAVLNGDKTTGITTMYMDAGMDTGDMILKKEVEIGEDETTGELWDRLSKIGGELLVETLDKINKGTAPRIKQNDSEATIAPMLDKKMAKIDWENKTAEEIKNLVRGLNPIMGAYTFLNEKKIKFWKVKVIEEQEFQNALDLGTSANGMEVRIPSSAPMELSNKEMPNGAVLLSDSKKGLFIKTKKGILQILEIQGENAKRMNISDFLRGNKIEEFQVFE